MPEPRETHAAIDARRNGQGGGGVACDEEVADNEGYATPCGRRAVGYRIDPEENEPYPVCATHHRWPYADQWVALAAKVQRVRDICDDPQGNLDERAVRVRYERIRAALDAALPDPATDTGGEDRG